MPDTTFRFSYSFVLGKLHGHPSGTIPSRSHFDGQRRHCFSVPIEYKCRLILFRMFARTFAEIGGRTRGGNALKATATRKARGSCCRRECFPALLAKRTLYGYTNLVCLVRDVASLSFVVKNTATAGATYTVTFASYRRVEYQA